MTTRREFIKQTTTVGILAATAPISCALKTSQSPVRSTMAPVGMVQTVQGPLHPSKLGFTLTHEHICAGSPGLWRAWPELFGGRANFIARIVDWLKAARDEGINTLIDVTTFDTGRDIRLIEEVARKSGMQIVACTGQHLFAPPSFGMLTVEQLTEFFIREIEQGIEGTGIKAGVIKVATASGDVSPSEEKALRAAARTSKATGIPIATHTHARLRGGEKQAEILEAEGVSPARVSLGHSDDSDDMDYLIGLARRGYILGMDHINRGLKPTTRVPWQKRAECIKKLIAAGFVGKIFLSNDWILGDSVLDHGDTEEREKNNPDGMLFGVRKVIPYLEQIGVSTLQIHAITVENPASFFCRG